MLAACPSFAPMWDAFLSEWVGNPILTKDGGGGSLPLYLVLSELADHLIEKLETGNVQEFPAVFYVVEQWISHGSHYVSEAAVVGLLEDLSAGGRYQTASPRDIVKWLGPKSRKWWAEVIDFWDRLDKGKFRPLSVD